ncbi:MAG: DUF2089 domain-containing protein [Gammaproteobacteria bacterium]|nr:DUF2089 domain-containing protein [Gammaproteobacteria bacterium]
MDNTYRQKEHCFECSGEYYSQKSTYLKYLSFLFNFIYITVAHMRICLSCHSALEIGRMHCRACNLSYEGRFAVPRLARLDDRNLELAELFILTGGSLKAMAETLAISYPTLRKRVDEMISQLQDLRTADQQFADQLLESVEKGDMTAEEAARIGRERNGTA